MYHMFFLFLSESTCSFFSLVKLVSVRPTQHVAKCTGKRVKLGIFSFGMIVGHPYVPQGYQNYIVFQLYH